MSARKNGARRERHSVERHRLALGRSSPQENEVQRRNPLLFIPRLPPKVVRKRATFAVKILRSAGRREGEALRCLLRLFKQGRADWERRFAVSSGCLSRAERTGRGALLSPSRGLSSYSRKIFHRKVFRVCGGREFLGNLFSYKRFPEANLRSKLAPPFPRRLND